MSLSTPGSWSTSERHFARPNAAPKMAQATGDTQQMTLGVHGFYENPVLMTMHLTAISNLQLGG